ncbi:MFS transporter [Nocardia sp. CDC159]|uniref:MFS transporter n=1 Tax=Nocardia pulmonis TaxID=2951408 RepID=A0A9X2J0E7_9NOCA|nr:MULTISPECIES: MFS transporter [Nocardia]MCM6778478.1 MFS transporter [Nocardia pulmonis]MCM6791367.1 MFS transporter [Nocardia sp. CDC159]
MSSARDRVVMVVLTVACAVTSSNIYINQPLLTDMAKSFGVSEGVMGVVPTATQFGYALGILLLVPLGDSLDRRTLIIALSVATTLALTAAAATPSLLAFAVISFGIGVLTPIPQIVIPLGVALSTGRSTGSVIGVLQGGLLVGLLASRAYAGALAEVAGWRAVYWCSVALMTVLIVLLLVAVPRRLGGTAAMPYHRLLASLAAVLRSDRLVGRICTSGALIGISFGAFWTTLTFLLQNSYGYGPAVAGLFGLVAAASALASPRAGRLADRKGGRYAQIALLAVSITSWIFLACGAISLIPLVLGVILLDVGVWGNQVVNQAMLFTLAPEYHSRLNTLYFTTRFLGIAFGSLAASQLWDAGGWYALCVLGVAALLLAAPVLATTHAPVAATDRGEVAAARG